MKRRKLSISVLLALGLFLSLSFASWAQPEGMQGHRRPQGLWGKFANLTPDQAGKLFDLRQKFLVDTASLRKDKAVKQAELRALWRAENPDEKQILAKLKEINAIRDKLQEKFVPFRIEVKKLLPKSPGPKGSLSMEDCGPDQETLIAMEFGFPVEIGL
jgi:zinc resistance-associated protein